MTESPRSNAISIEHAERINYSLQQAGLAPVVRLASVPPEKPVRLKIPPYSEEILLPPGASGNLSIPLNADQFARLSAPVEARLVLEVEGRGSESRPIWISPLCAWSRRRENAAATAAFVLENDPVVAELVRRAGTTPSPADRPPIEDTAERLFDELAPFFGPCYLFERNSFPEDEQAIRFPLQMKYDLGGTCVDLALAYAAALLRSGVSPLLVLVGDEQGPRHVLVGLWVLPRPGLCPAVPSGPLLGQLLRDGAWIPVEVTWACRGATYEGARRKAEEQIGSTGILWGVDVAAARASGIHSLPERPCTTTFGSWKAHILDERTKTLVDVAAETLKGMTVEVVWSGHPADLGKTWELHGFCARIGRGHQHEIGLFEPTVSNPHAVLLVKEGSTHLANLSTKNPAWVEEAIVPYGGSHPIHPGQAFRVGGVTLRLNRS